MERPEQPADSLDFDGDVGALKRKSVRGGAVLGVLQLCQVFLQLAWTVAMARLLRPEDFGLVAMAVPLVSLIGIIRDMGLADAVLRRPRLTYAEMSNLYWVSLAIHVAAFCLFVAAAPLVGLFYGAPEVSWIVAAYSLLLLLNGVASLHVALLTRRLQFARVGLIKLVGFTVGAAAGVVVGLIWHTYWALVVMGLTVGLTELLMAWLMSGWVPSRPHRGTNVRTMVDFGANVGLSRLMNYASSNADTVIVGKVLGAVALGFYDRAYRLMVTPTSLLLKPLESVAPSIFSRLLDTPDVYRRSVLGAMGLVLMATMPGMLFAVVMAPLLIPLAYGHGWDPVVPIFQAFGVAAVLRFQMVMLDWLFVVEGRSRAYRHWGVARASVMIAGFAIGVNWGALGVAASYAIAIALLLPVQAIWLGRTSPVRPADIGRSIVILVPGAGMAVSTMLWLVRARPLPDWAALILALAASYGLVIAVAALFPSGRATMKGGIVTIREGLRRS
ncbi:lipopolysaccharide biosynthesis protein [Iodidimonas sp. SYSU 1G8]|uniref:lipopolysaccharide biosynthesis protein n=1 Tax=Iodidimonas sp. SYSU 1G8 TaxID=3133967 RepID=UPI0031FE7E63